VPGSSTSVIHLPTHGFGAPEKIWGVKAVERGEGEKKRERNRRDSKFY